MILRRKYVKIAFESLQRLMVHRAYPQREVMNPFRQHFDRFKARDWLTLAIHCVTRIWMSTKKMCIAQFESSAKNVHFCTWIWIAKVKLSYNNYFLFFLGIVAVMESQAFRRQLSFKDALLNKYSLEEDDEELCFIHISGSPKHKGKRSLGFNKKGLMLAITGFFRGLLFRCQNF